MSKMTAAQGCDCRGQNLIGRAGFHTQRQGRVGCWVGLLRYLLLGKSNQAAVVPLCWLVAQWNEMRCHSPTLTGVALLGRTRPSGGVAPSAGTEPPGVVDPWRRGRRVAQRRAGARYLVLGGWFGGVALPAPPPLLPPSSSRAGKPDPWMHLQLGVARQAPTRRHL